MAITRTSWVDDDGTGTTGTIINNAEKTLLYNQIDAALVELITNGTFALTDVSGGGLGHIGDGYFTKAGKAVLVQFVFHYPPGIVTYQGNLLGGLPFPVNTQADGGFYMGWGPIDYRFYALPGTVNVQILNATTGGVFQNASLTSAEGYVHGVYFVD